METNAKITKTRTHTNLTEVGSTWSRTPPTKLYMDIYTKKTVMHGYPSFVFRLLKRYVCMTLLKVNAESHLREIVWAH